MKIGAFAAKLLAKAGINTFDPKYADLLSAATELPDEDANKVFGALFNLDDAKNNSDLKRHFTASILDGADQEINRIMDEMGMEVTDKDELKAEKNTYQRIGKLSKKIQDLEKKKAGATTTEKSELQKQINDATSKIAELQKTHGEEIKRINSEWQGKLTNSTIKSILAGKKYANKDIPVDVQVETAMVLLNRELEKQGAKIINSNGILTLKQSKDESLDWLNSANEKPSFEQFVDGTLATLKLLAVNDSAAPANVSNYGNGLPTAGNNGAPVINGGGNKNVNQELVDAFNKSIQDVDKAFR